MAPEEYVKNANIMKDFIQHPGFSLLTDRINKKIDFKRTEWLSASTPEDAEKIRQDSRVYAAMMGLINEFLMRGSQAESQLEAQRNQQNQSR